MGIKFQKKKERSQSVFNYYLFFQGNQSNLERDLIQNLRPRCQELLENSLEGLSKENPKIPNQRQNPAWNQINST